MELETKLVEHVEQKVEDISVDDILRVEVTGSPWGVCPCGLWGCFSGGMACGAWGWCWSWMVEVPLSGW